VLLAVDDLAAHFHSDGVFALVDVVARHCHLLVAHFKDILDCLLEAQEIVVDCA
jgi:hypothetical protein